MSSKQSTVDFILEQISEAGSVSARKMFGEYGIFCDGKMAALVCDDELFVKITPEGKAFIDDCPEKSPYPGAKPCFFISGEKWEESEWLTSLIRITTLQLPIPKKKPRKSKKLEAII